MNRAGSSSGQSRINNDLRASVGTAATSSTATDGRPTSRLREPRSLPPWIDSYETGYGTVTEDQLQLLNPPPPSQRPQRNNAPAPPERRVSRDGYVDWDDPLLATARQSRFPPLLKRHRPERGRKWDHLRSAEPVIVPSFARTAAVTSSSSTSAAAARRTTTTHKYDPAQAWSDFVRSSTYGHLPYEKSEVVDVEMLRELQPNFDKESEVPGQAAAGAVGPDGKPSSRSRRTLALYKRVWKTVIHHPFSPLIFRMTVIVTSILALAFSARIEEYENDGGEMSDGSGPARAERSQAIVAVAVDTVAIPYVGYMIWDEYTGKPLGLRPARQKIGLILMDLFFIIFKSASTSLAFEALVYHNDGEGYVLKLSKALASFMLVGLISWTMTFIVNVFRTVERLGGGEDESTRM